MLVPFKQSDYSGIGKGVCWALSLKWVQLALSGKCDNQSARIEMLKAWVPQAIKLHAKYHEFSVALESEDLGYVNKGVQIDIALIEYLGARIGIKIDRTKVKEVIMNTTDTLENLDAITERLRTPGTGHILIFSYSDGTGHAMATRARKAGLGHKLRNATFLFDPNEGEVDLPIICCKILLEETLQKKRCYYAVNL